MNWCDPGAHQPGSDQEQRGFAAVDVHYLGDLGARAALLTSADPTFATVAGCKTAVVPDPGPYRSGEFYLRELPPLRAVLEGEAGLALIVHRRIRGSGSAWQARSWRLRPRRVRRARDRRREDAIRNGDPRRAGTPRALRPAAVCHGRWPDHCRRGQDGQRDGWSFPHSRRATRRRQARQGHHGSDCLADLGQRKLTHPLRQRHAVVVWARVSP